MEITEADMHVPGLVAAVAALVAGGVAVIPTDTVYGIVAVAADARAVARVYAVRGRDPGKACIVLLPDAAALRGFGIVPDVATGALLSRVWPGPVSVVLSVPPARMAADMSLHRGTGQIAFRVPADDALRALLRQTGPLIAPSANPQGMPPATTVVMARAYFGAMVDAYADGGTRAGVPSAVVRPEVGGRLTVLRPGPGFPAVLAGIP